jgi:uncharacterized protein
MSLQAVIAGFPTSPFTDAGAAWAIGMELTFGAIALLFLRIRGFAIETLLPHPTLKGSLIGIGIFFAAWIVGALATSPFSALRAEQPISQMVSSTRMSIGVIVFFALVNGTFEEVFLLGVLVRGLRSFGLGLAVGLPLLARFLYHLYQGPIGAIWVLAFGITFTLIYIRSSSLWPPVFAHVLWDIVPFTSAVA